ncbi:hypothetical protein CPB84DRAFT_1776153, partial [Gymnopilus junonius]
MWAPETYRKEAFNSFAVYVYQTSRLFYTLRDIADNQPRLVKILQDMSLRNLRSIIPNDQRERRFLRVGLSESVVIPRNPLLTLRDMLE